MIRWFVIFSLCSAAPLVALGQLQPSAGPNPGIDYVPGAGAAWAGGLLGPPGSRGDDLVIGPRQMLANVMVLYTGLAKSAYGQEGVEDRIALAVAYMNEACNRSGVEARFRLVYQGEAHGHEEDPDILKELEWLRCDPGVAALREQVGAEFVSLFVRDGYPTGGRGVMLGEHSVFNGSACVFAHELGHNLGCAHNREDAGDSAPLEGCSFGYSFIPPGSSFLYGDIMSYRGSQIEQFSNPDRYFMGAPTGVPEFHVDPDGNPDAADIRLTMNRYLPYVTGGGRPSRISVLSGPSLTQDGSEFSFEVSTTATGSCTVESSSDLDRWAPLTTVDLAGESVVIDDSRSGARQRFYRARIDGRPIATQVGFIVKVLPPGFSMLANQLETRQNLIGTLMPDVPEGTQVYKWIEGLSEWAVNTFSLGWWDDPVMTLHPGEGVIIRNPAPTPFTVTFVGEVNGALHNRVPVGESIRSSAIAQGGLLSATLRFRPVGPGAQVIRMINGRYAVYTLDEEGWSPSEPVMELGEAFWCRNPVNPFIWERVLRSGAD